MEQERGHQNGRQRETSRGERDRSIVPARSGEHHISDDRSQNESNTKRRADQSQSLCAILFIRAICHRGLRRGQVRAGESVNDAREKRIHKRVRKAEQDEADECSELAEEQNRFAPEAIRQSSEDRRADELHRRIRGLQNADDERVCAEARREQRHQWNDDGQAHQVYQHDGDDGQDAFEIEFIGGGFGSSHNFKEFRRNDSTEEILV